MNIKGKKGKNAKKLRQQLAGLGLPSAYSQHTADVDWLTWCIYRFVAMSVEKQLAVVLGITTTLLTFSILLGYRMGKYYYPNHVNGTKTVSVGSTATVSTAGLPPSLSLQASLAEKAASKRKLEQEQVQQN